VELVDANKDAARVFQMVRSQTLDRIVISGMGGGYSRPYTLNHVAVWMMIDALKVKNRLDCFNRVLTVFHEWLNNQED